MRFRRYLTIIAPLRNTPSSRALSMLCLLRPLSATGTPRFATCNSQFLVRSPRTPVLNCLLKSQTHCCMIPRQSCRQSSLSPDNESKVGDDKLDTSKDVRLQGINEGERILDDGTSPTLLFGNFLFLPFIEKLGGLAASIGALGLGMLGLLYVKQGDLLYIPTIDGIGRYNHHNPKGYRSPAEYSVPFETHMIKSTDDVAVHSWLLLHPESKKRQLPTIVFFHGNAGNIGIRLPNAVELYELGANVLQVEYRGYGESTPQNIKPTEKGIKADAEAVLDFVSDHPSIDHSRIFMFGRSLGGAVAFHVADYAEQNNLPLAGIIVENTFESIAHMVDILFPFLSPLKGMLLRNKWDSTNLAAKLKIPILYIAGDNDEIVPYAHMRNLYAKSSKSSSMHRFHRVEGGTHNETWLQGGHAYWKAIESFLTHVPTGK